MNPEIEIRDCQTRDIREMSCVMQDDSMETAFKLGLTPSKALWRSYKQSIYCKSAFINGKIAAIWGLGGAMFGEKAMPWLILSPEASDYPMRVAFVYRAELNKMAKMFGFLEDFVATENEKAIRMLELMGFKIDRKKIAIGDGNFYHAERVS